MEQQEIREKIIAEIANTEKQIADYKEKTAPIPPDNAIGRISRMDAIVNKSVMEASLNKAIEKLNKLNYALSRVDTPEFGICIKCGRAIPVGRILVVPESPYCVQCAA